MNCDNFKDSLVDFAYGEAGEEARREMAMHVAGCPECGSAAEDLRITRSFLQAWPEEEAEPAKPFVVFSPRHAPRRSRFPSRAFPWYAAAAALVLGLGATLLLVSQTSVRFRGQAVEIRFGKSDGGASPATAPNLEEVKRLIAQSEERQAERFMEMVQTAYVHLEGERQGDRQAIQQGFDLIKEVYMDQIQKNNQLLELSLQGSSYPTNYK